MRKRGRRPSLPRPKEIEEGKEMDVKVIARGKKRGDGIAKVEGFVVIVQGGDEVGKEYHVKITRVAPTVAFAEVVS